jgi:predicted regulator of Ras-like GTPase activity (Roadblock/LC7/MglB family)
MSVLDDILREMNQRGQFRVAVLTSSLGLPVATASSKDDTEIASAMAGILQRVSKRVREPLGMAEVEEMVLRARDNTRLVCRYFYVGSEELILAVMVDAGAYYRSATSRAMREIEAIWKTGALA